MVKQFATGLALFTCLTSAGALAVDFDGSKALICATMEISECDAGAGCERVSAESIGAPLFFRIDFAARMIRGVGADKSERTSAVERMERLDGRLILQGAEEAVEGVRGGLGWSMAIAEDSGRMVVTGSGDQVGFVIFGACTPL